jgi:hypothetical protein
MLNASRQPVFAPSPRQNRGYVIRVRAFRLTVRPDMNWRCIAFSGEVGAGSRKRVETMLTGNVAKP